MKKSSVIAAMILGLAPFALHAGGKSTGGVGTGVWPYPIFLDDTAVSLPRSMPQNNVTSPQTPSAQTPIAQAPTAPAPTGQAPASGAQTESNLVLARHPFGAPPTGASGGGIVQMYLQSLDQ